MKNNLFHLFILLGFFGMAQDTLKGTLFTLEDNQEIPLTGASIYWIGTQIGTTTN